MYRSSCFLAAALIGTNVVVVQQVAGAKSAVEVGRIAKAITVEIKAIGSTDIGSGILLQRQGDVYTVLTSGHVANKSAAFTLKTADGQVHQAIAGSIRLAGNNIDLGVMKFRSNNNYTLAKIGTSNPLEELSSIYVAGFPERTYAVDSGTINITKGEVIGKANQGDSLGYSLIYSNTTFRGMSGGPVLNEAGELVAIHGKGDRDGKKGEGEKLGRNLGIVIERFGNVAIAMGIQLDQQISNLPQNQSLNASDYYLRGESKYENQDYGGALADYDQAIILNPKFSKAYFSRAFIKSRLKNTQGAMSDYDQVIVIDPKNIQAYFSRATLKQSLNDTQGAISDLDQVIVIDPKNIQAYFYRATSKSRLNDTRGAISDYNQVIVIDPKNTTAYIGRARLKSDKLNDSKGALADYNRAIVIDPKNAIAYISRAKLKSDKLNDFQGALADYNRAIVLDPEDSFAYYDRARLKADKLNDFLGALTDYNRVIALVPIRQPSFIGLPDIDNHWFLSLCYFERAKLKADKLSNFQGALTDYNQAIILNPENYSAYHRRAILNVDKLNDLRSALADYNQTIVLQPKYATAYYNRGILKYFKLKDKTGGIQDFQRAAQLYREQGELQQSQKTIEVLRQLGVN
jgi:tetratricopeptide (TPR) repeat protein